MRCVDGVPAGARWVRVPAVGGGGARGREPGVGSSGASFWRTVGCSGIGSAGISS